MSSDNTVILACRRPHRAAEARRAIANATGNSKVREMQLDLSSMASVRDFAARCNVAVESIDGLLCNAGIARGPATNSDDVDTVFATNHLGHFLLTLSLLGRMAPAGRVIAVTSDMHQPPGPRLMWPGAETVAHPGRWTKASHLRYSYSKLCTIYFVHELSRRLSATGSTVWVAAFNPGLMTETSFASTPRPVGALLKRVFASRVGDLDTSGAALAQLATRADTADLSGQYFDRNASTWTRSSELSYNVQNARELWELSARLTGIDTGSVGPKS